MSAGAGVKVTVLVPDAMAAQRLFIISAALDVERATDGQLSRALADCTALRFALFDEVARRRTAGEQ